MHPWPRAFCFSNGKLTLELETDLGKFQRSLDEFPVWHKRENIELANLVTHLEAWRPTCSSEFRQQLGLESTPDRHIVYEYSAGGTRFLIPAMVLLTSLFRPLHKVAASLFSPDSLAGVATPILDSDGLKDIVFAPRQMAAVKELREGQVKEFYTWQLSFPTASGFTKSVFLNALNGHIAVDLPKAVLVTALSGERSGNTFFVYRMTPEAIVATESPFFWNKRPRRVFLLRAVQHLGTHKGGIATASSLPHDLTPLNDQEWAAFGSLLRGKRRNKRQSNIDARSCVNAIFEKYQTNATWLAVTRAPLRQGDAQTRLLRWRAAGHWARFTDALDQVRGSTAPSAVGSQLIVTKRTVTLTPRGRRSAIASNTSPLLKHTELVFDAVHQNARFISDFSSLKEIHGAAYFEHPQVQCKDAMQEPVYSYVHGQTEFRVPRSVLIAGFLSWSPCMSRLASGAHNLEENFSANQSTDNLVFRDKVANAPVRRPWDASFLSWAFAFQSGRDFVSSLSTDTQPNLDNVVCVGEVHGLATTDCFLVSKMVVSTLIPTDDRLPAFPNVPRTLLFKVASNHKKMPNARRSKGPDRSLMRKDGQCTLLNYEWDALQSQFPSLRSQFRHGVDQLIIRVAEGRGVIGHDKSDTPPAGQANRKTVYNRLQEAEITGELLNAVRRQRALIE